MRTSVRVITLLLVSLLHISHTLAQQHTRNDVARKERWVDSVFQALTPEERIAQLLVIRAYSNRDQTYSEAITAMIRQVNPGGVCFFQGSPGAQATLTNRWQQVAKTPLLIAIDAEWGLGMRLDSVPDFPFQMTLGASADDSLLHDMASAIARDCRRIGVHLNLAPVADVNNNPGNPVINFRSFGEDPMSVARKGSIYMKAMQDKGILSAAKHFPGHGDTDTDSHLELPVISHPKKRLWEVELLPFREVIRNRAHGIMIAHLYIPSLDSTPNLPSTLSPAVVTGLLKEEMGFGGCVITDALDMQGVTRYFPPGEIEVKALLAGNDILLLPQDVIAAVNAIRQAVLNGTIPEAVVNDRCRKMIGIKFELGLDRLSPVQIEKLTSDLNSPVSEAIISRIYKSAVTLVKNENNLLPLILLQRRQIASVSIGSTGATPFQESLGYYAPVTHFQVSRDAAPEELKDLEKNLKPFSLVIIGLHRNNLYPENRFGNPEEILGFIGDISRQKRTILTIFGNPYLLNDLVNTNDPEAILVTYQDQAIAEKVAAEVIFGGVAAQGHLPVSTSAFPSGTGILTTKSRLEFVQPEEIGIPSADLASIDSLVIRGIDSAAYPGCEVLFARNGKIFYHKAFGYPSYDDTAAVTLTDIYDIASLTKVAATTLAVMKLVEEAKIHPDDPLSMHLPELRGTDKEKITIREAMAHQAGLHPWIPFYTQTQGDSLAGLEIYDTINSLVHPIRVADHMYMKRAYCDSIFQWIIRSELRKNKEYKYSDLGFYLLMKIVERKTGKGFGEYLEETFYKPLGLSTLGFHPRERVPLSRIMPTEYDTVFRMQQIRGDVHDPGAAMLGGMAGHAGLFSDSFDLAVILEMLLNYGEYGGKQYFLPSTIREFTRKQFPGKQNRRGMGFDRPLPEFESGGPTCEAASATSFGHSGFTGTYMWADPANGLLYVFLSNRICPDAGNTRISGMNIRTALHQKMYDIIRKNEGK